MPIVTVSSKGQIVLPAEAHAIKQGDKFELRVSEGKLELFRLARSRLSACMGLSRVVPVRKCRK